MTDLRCLSEVCKIDFRTKVYTLRVTPGESDGGSNACRSAVNPAQIADGMLRTNFSFLPGGIKYL